MRSRPTQITHSFMFCLVCSVAITPAVTGTLSKNGFSVLVERGAGLEAKFRDDDYVQAGANIVDGNSANAADIVLKVRQPHEADISQFQENSTLISFLYPAQNKDLVNKLAERKINAFGKFNSIDRVEKVDLNVISLFV